MLRWNHFLFLYPLLIMLTYPILAESPERYKVICIQSSGGCPCQEKGQVLYHLEAVESVPGGREPEPGMERVDGGRGVCTFPTDSLRKLEGDVEGIVDRRDHTPAPLEKMLAPDDFQSVTKNEGVRRLSLGDHWITYYHLAREVYSPGPATPVLDPKGRELGRASTEFLKQVMWEGSGVALDGKRYHYSGQSMRFTLYPESVPWGYGAGYGYQVFPYRTLAMNYPGLCQALKGILPGPCSKKELIGSLVHFPSIAGKKIPVAGQIHDGYFCITDTGSPSYIKKDRIDVFVGTHGGGNPYLPYSRRLNDLIRGGIKNIVPSDWRLWKTEKERVWCEPEDRNCTIDYHTTAKERALDLVILLDRENRPIKCKKGDWGN